MGFNQALFDEHLAEVSKATLPYYEYDSLWKAFNCYCSSFYRESDPRRLEETALIYRAVAFVPESQRASILSQTLTQPSGCPWCLAGKLKVFGNTSTDARIRRTRTSAVSAL